MAQSLELRLLVEYAGWSRSPQVALALAELYFSAAKQLAASKANSTGKPGAKKGTARTVKHKFNSSMHGCGANLGLFEAAMLQQHSRVSLTAAHPDTAATAMNSGSTSNRAVDQHHVSDAVVQSHQLQARYHWLQACISEHSKHLGDAAHQLEACMLAIDALSQISSKSQQEVSVAVSPPGAAAITAQAVTQKLDELNMLIMVQEGRKSLEQGQHQALISRLVPVLLSDTPDGLPMDVPHQLAGLQLLQVRQQMT